MKTETIKDWASVILGLMGMIGIGLVGMILFSFWYFGLK